jgi:hypothetical protein
MGKQLSKARFAGLQPSVGELCPKSPRWCGFGFAAGCEAVAMPRRRGAFTFLGYALGAAFGPMNPKG